MATAIFESEAQVLHGPKDLRMVRMQVHPPLPNEVQIEIRSTTLCGSDVHYYTSYHNGGIHIKEPLSQGHESAGQVVMLGSEIARSGTLKVGDKVALEVGIPCDECEVCTRGRYNICEEMRFRSSAVSFPHFQGTLQSRINHPGKWCHKLPESMSYDEGALLEPLAVAVHAVQRANVTKSSRCLIIGAGAVGLLCAAAAQAVGCEDITIADIALNRLEFAHDKGFATAICPVMARRGATIDDSLAIAKETAEEFKMAGSVRGQYAGGSFHTTFECSGVESCVQAAIYATRAGGKVLLVGMGTPIQTLPIAAASLREVDLVGVWRYANTYPVAIEIMKIAGKNGCVPDIKSVITHSFKGLKSVPEAFELAARTTDQDGRLVVKVVVHN